VPPALPASPVPLAASPRERLARVAPVQGRQVYECAARADAASGFGWVHVASEFEDAPRLQGRHTPPGGRPSSAPLGRGPDNVQGTVMLQVAAPGLDAIPWQRIRVDATSGDAHLDELSSIHRTHTRGGLPPAVPCTAAEAGRQQRVAYSAEYEFYVAR